MGEIGLMNNLSFSWFSECATHKLNNVKEYFVLLFGCSYFFHQPHALDEQQKVVMDG
jgi:hypothetical protein